MLGEEVKAVIWKEILDKYRTRWIQISILALVVFTLGIAYFGSSPAGVVGFRKFESIVVSLLSLVTYIIPLIALLLGAGAIAEEREKGTFEIILSSPLTSWDIWMGKFFGLSLVLILTILGGLIPALILLILKFGSHIILSVTVFLVSSILLGMSMLSLSFLLSLIFEERTRITISAVLLWVVAVILYDLSLLGILILTKGMVLKSLFTLLLLTNPIDVFRMINLLSVGELKAILGFVTIEIPSYLRPHFLWIVLALWIVIPLMLSYKLFNRRFRV